MAQNPLVPKKRKASEARPASGSIPSNLPKSTRRKFLKMAGVVSAVVLLEKQARAMAVPKFDSKWLAAIKAGDIDLNSYYQCCDGESDPNCFDYDDSADAMGVSVLTQETGYWCWIAAALSVAQYFGKRTNWGQCNLYDAVQDVDIAGFASWGSCCGADTSSLCLKAGRVTRALDFCEMISTYVPSSVDFTVIAREVAVMTSPVIIHFGPSNTWGSQPIYHFEVITGVSCLWDSTANMYVGHYDIGDTNGTTHLGYDSRNVNQLISGTVWNGTVIGIQPVSEY